jgi:hypothetical protein
VKGSRRNQIRLTMGVARWYFKFASSLSRESKKLSALPGRDRGGASDVD